MVEKNNILILLFWYYLAISVRTRRRSSRPIKEKYYTSLTNLILILVMDEIGD